MSVSGLAVGQTRRIGYLSAAPRVSTRASAETSGPRAHILGVIRALEAQGWAVRQYIVGDRISPGLMVGSEARLLRSTPLRLLADIARVILGLRHSLLSWRELRDQVDMVYERMAVFQALGWTFQRRGVPWIIESNGLHYHEARFDRKSIVLAALAKQIEIWAYRRCDALVCITQELKDLIVQTAGIEARKVLVVPNGVDPAHFERSRHVARRLFDGPTLGFVSALIDWHRVDILLHALSELRAEGIVLGLTVVGDGPMRAAWEGQAEALGLTGCVHFVGRVSWEDVPAYMSGFDLGYVGNGPMTLGRMYHSPLKLYEYMAMSLPVLSADCADAREMIQPGRTGYIFERADREDLKRALRTAYRGRAQWREMGAAARRKVQVSATWHVRVRDMMKGIERILEEGHAGSPTGRLV